VTLRYKSRNLNLSKQEMSFRLKKAFLIPLSIYGSASDHELIDKKMFLMLEAKSKIASLLNVMFLCCF
jgi:hypothetical protein